MSADPTKLRRTYRHRIYPTGKQAAALTAQLGQACDLYNAALQHRRASGVITQSGCLVVLIPNKETRHG